jgi:hypothetical protein
MTKGAPVFPVMRRVYLTAVACAVLEFFFLFQPSTTIGAENTFAPQIISSEGELEIGMASQTNENTENGTGTKSTGTSLHESINLAADGYVYHPRFLLFLTKLSGVLNEWSNTGSVSNAFRSARGEENYELRTILLPEHPYNLELFTRHQQASAVGTFLRSQTGTLDEQGAIFNYKNNPLFLHSSYVSTSVESAQQRTDSNSYRMNGSYTGSVMSNTAAYTHTESSSSLALRTLREEYTFGNTARVANLALDSRIVKGSSDQQKPLGPEFRADTLSWTEQLTAPLPWNFSSGASFGYFDENRMIGEYQTDPEKKEFNRSATAVVNLSHRLYQSLMTNYTFNNNTIKSTTGEITTRSDALSSVYLKAIPYGRLTAGIYLSRADSERTGTPSIINEVHNAALLGAFSLTLRNINESTIILQVIDPSTGGLITLPPSDYLTNRLGDAVQITIVSISPVAPQADPTSVYEFHVFYSLLNQSEIVMTARGYSFRLDLIRNLLGLYYNYTTSDQEVVSGSLTGGSGRDTTEITGITVQSGPYSGLVEHQNFRSWQNPSETWKTMGQYLTPLADNANISARLSYQRIDYSPSSSTLVIGKREERSGVNMTFDKRILHENLNFFISTSYDRSKSFIIVNTQSINSYLNWQVGLLSVNGGVQISRSESTMATHKVVIASQYYYVTVTRKLF